MHKGTRSSVVLRYENSCKNSRNKFEHKQNQYRYVELKIITIEEVVSLHSQQKVGFREYFKYFLIW